MTDAAMQHRLRPGGAWQAVLRGVYVAQTGVPTADQRDMAALLYAGRGSVITGASALLRHGLRAPRPARVDVLVPAVSKRRGSGFVRVQRTARIPELICVSGQLRFALAARAVADAARGLTDLREVRAIVADSVQRGWCTVDELRGELRQGPAAGSAMFRRVLDEVADGIRSAVEAELRDLIKNGGLPMPMFNTRLYVGGALLAVADAWWPDAGVAAEADSRDWHLSPEDWEQTLRRHARMSAQGILVLHFTPKQIRTERARVITTIRAALQAGRSGAQPSVRAVPATG